MSSESPEGMVTVSVTRYRLLAVQTPETSPDTRTASARRRSRESWATLLRLSAGESTESAAAGSSAGACVSVCSSCAMTNPARARHGTRIPASLFQVLIPVSSFDGRRTCALADSSSREPRDTERGIGHPFAGAPAPWPALRRNRHPATTSVISRIYGVPAPWTSAYRVIRTDTLPEINLRAIAR